MSNRFPSKSLLKKSGLIFSGIFFFIFGALPYFLKGDLKLSILFLSTLIFILSLINPFSLRRPYLIWIKFGDILSKINSKLILAIFFYLFITPAALVRNLLKSFLRMRKKVLSSYTLIDDKNSSTFKDEY